LVLLFLILGVSVLAGYPIFLSNARDSIRTLLQGFFTKCDKIVEILNGKFFHILTSCFITAIVIIIGVQDLFINMNLIIGLIGSSFSIFVMFLFPAILYFTSHFMNKNWKENIFQIFVFFPFVLLFISTIGVTSFGFFVANALNQNQTN
jgi:uncharacterized membrane protein